MGKNMKRMLLFAIRYQDGWHSWQTTDRATRDAIKCLEKQGFIETNKHHQFRLKTKDNPPWHK